MGCYLEAEEDLFFDTHEEITSNSDMGSDCSDDCSTSGLDNCVSSGFGYKSWAENLESVHERRDRFFKWMGLTSEWNSNEREELGDDCSDEIRRGVNRTGENTKAMPRNSDFEDRFMGNSRSCRSDEALESVRPGTVEDNSGSFDEGTMSSPDELGQDELIRRLREVGTDRLAVAEEFSSSLVLQSSRKEAETSNLLDRRKKLKKGWLQNLNVMARIVNRQGEHLQPSGIKPKVASTAHTVRVHSHRKQSKELSSVYANQEFPAHKGSILTMKFSHDGQYLASAGEDGIVCVWKVVEEERPNTFDTQGTDHSLYFSINHVSKLALLDVDKEKVQKTSRLRKSSESACVIFPPKVFQILEKPLHEFHGHGGEVLALSWSRKGYLLSASVDKTVRMWQVGHDQCLKVFSHNNYVTCVEFNPVDENYFISGSIDGKVRIWEVRGRQVIDWIDIREIVTAVCYRPNGKGTIVGTMDGNCCFYDIIDNHMRPDAQICLKGKKKLPGKRITGLEFCPSDPNKVMVSSADSQVRILRGVNIECKLKGTRGQMSATFTSDGKHIVSTTEDSNVYVWNHNRSDHTSSKPKNILSCENFVSQNASVAIPWGGMKTTGPALPSPTLSSLGNGELPRMPILSPDCFSLSRGFFLESLCKGSPTWPAETLPDSSNHGNASSPQMRRSEYRFLKNAYQNTLSSPHMWGLVIVTAGWDGRIRTFLNYGLPIRL